MEWVETTGKTVEEAKEAALDRLGIDHDEAEFQVLEEPRPGLFGRIRGEARVRARVAPRTPRPKQDRRDRRRGGGRERARPQPTGGGDGEEVVSEAGEARPARSTRSRRPAARTAASVPAGTAPAESADAGAAGEEGGGGVGVVAEQEPTDEAGTESATASSRSGRRRGSARPARPTPPIEAADDAAATIPGVAGTTQEGPTVTVTLEEQTTIAEQFLKGLLEAFDLEAELATSNVDEGTNEIDIAGPDLGLLIGPRGHTIAALQELTRIVLQKQAGGSYEGRIRVDVAGYRQRRREALARFTEQVAGQVRESGSRKALEPMNAADRKVVHDTVNDLEGVHTVSEGEEPRRWVVIVPD